MGEFVHFQWPPQTKPKPTPALPLLKAELEGTVERLAVRRKRRTRQRRWRKAVARHYSGRLRLRGCSTGGRRKQRSW